MLPKIKYWLKTQPARFRQAYNSVSMPPLMRVALLIASAAIPFVVFALFQVEEPPQTVTAQEPANLRQQVPLQFPFGNLEASPSPSPTESPSPQPSPTRSRRTTAPPPPPPPAPAPVAPAEPEPSPQPSPDPDPSPSPSPSPEPSPTTSPTPSPKPSPSPSPSPKPSPSPTPSPKPSPSPADLPACSNGIDDDGDGKIDMDDVGCFDEEDDDE